MAVTIITTDLIQPAGDLDSSYFPENNLDALLPGWLANAATQVEADGNISDQDGAATAWVYYRAYTYLTRRLASLPSSTTLMDQSASISDARIEHWEKLARQYKEQYDELSAPLVTAAPHRPASGWKPTQVTW